MNFFKLIFRNADKEPNKFGPETTAPKHKETLGAVAPAKNFERLAVTDDGFFTTLKVPYRNDGTLKPKTISDVFDFAYNMTFGGKGEHRDHRSGGHHERRSGEIFANAFQGKIAECAACNFFYRFDKSSKPDFAVYKLGKWDSVDLSVAGREVSVKSTKHFGQLLLLETKDWDENGVYIPNKENGVYDFILFIRLNPNCEDLLKEMRMLYSDTANFNDLKRAVLKQRWTYNYVGYITRDDLKFIIKNKYVLPRNALLNGKTAMDAENYYVQAGDLRSMDSLKEFFDDTRRN